MAYNEENISVCSGPGCDNEYVKSSWNKAYCSMRCKKVAENVRNRQNLTNDVVAALAPSYNVNVDDTVDFLRKEVQRLGRENDKLKNTQQEQITALRTAMHEGLSQIEMPPIQAPVLTKSRKAEEVAIVSISDVQLAKVTSTYNSDVAAERMAAYVDRVIEITNAQRQDHPVNDCHVWFLGDIIEGCFSGDTMVVTKQGLKPIKELADIGHAETKTNYGQWVDAPFRSFGKQRLWKLNLSRANNTVHKTVYTTAEHRWITLSNPSSNSAKQDVLTSDLVPGDMLVSNFGKQPVNMSPIGVMAGFVYGDGNRNAESDCSVNIYREKWDILKFFDGHSMSKIQHGATKENWNVTSNSDFIKVSTFPSFFKEVPSVGDESLSYLYGWAAGYFAADGHIANNGGSFIVGSTNLDAIRYFVDVCARIGIGTNPICSEHRKDVNGELQEFYSLTLVASTVPIDFLVRDSQRELVEIYCSKVKTSVLQNNTNKNWSVVSCEPTDQWEEVYCAIVPQTHTFTLANDLLTGNCGIFLGQSWLVDSGFYRQVTINGPNIFLPFLEKLLLNFETVTVYGVIGNHGRMGSRAKEEFDPESNGDRMLYRILQIAMRNESRISFNIPDGWGESNFYAIDHIGNYNSLLMHGHQFMSIISPATAKRFLGYKEAIQEDWQDLALGHFHQTMKLTFGKSVLRVMGTSESDNSYALEQLASTGGPSQHLMFADPVKGVITGEYDVDLSDI